MVRPQNRKIAAWPHHLIEYDSINLESDLCSRNLSVLPRLADWSQILKTGRGFPDRQVNIAGLK